MVNEALLLFDDFEIYRTGVMSNNATYVVERDDKWILKAAIDNIFIAIYEHKKTDDFVEDGKFVQLLKNMPSVVWVKEVIVEPEIRVAEIIDPNDDLENIDSMKIEEEIEVPDDN